MNNRLVALAMTGLLVMPVWVHAVPVTWTVDDWSFEDGGSASGQFTFDADANTYSDIAIVTTGGPVFGGANYGLPNPSGPVPRESFLFLLNGPMIDYTSTPMLALNWLEPLTNAGGRVGIDVLGQSFEGACANPACSAAMVERFFVHGTVAVVSEPPALALFGLSFLLGLRLVYRGNRRAAKIETAFPTQSTAIRPQGRRVAAPERISASG